MKVCFKCKEGKDLSEFYVHKRMADGHLNKCKDCTKKDAAARYADPVTRERIREYDAMRTKTPHRKSKMYEYTKNKRAKNPEKARAYRMVNHHIKAGNLTRNPCEVCGDPKTEGHHDDYSKPLDIRWLCFVHHRQAHGQNPKA